MEDEAGHTPRPPGVPRRARARVVTVTRLSKTGSRVFGPEADNLDGTASGGDSDRSTGGRRTKTSSGGSNLTQSDQSLSVDDSVSLRTQALFQTCLVAMAAVSLYTLLPRLAFGRSDLDVLQQLADGGFAVTYLCGVVRLRKAQASRQRAKNLSRLDDVEVMEDLPWSLGVLGHPLNIALHVLLGSAIPICTDAVALLALNPGYLRDFLILFPGSLRLLRLLGFGAIFGHLDVNLTVPHYPAFLVRNLLTLSFNTHAAACIFWALAYTNDFSEETWVGAQAPHLINATISSQYISSLYWSAVTASTVGYGDFTPISQAESLFTICFVLTNVIIVANIVGGVSALAAMADQDIANHRRVINAFEKMLTQERISDDVAHATRQYLRMQMHQAKAEIERLPVSVRTQIREQRFADALTSQPLLKGLSRRFINACIASVHEDTYVAGLDVIRANDVPDRFSIILDGFAVIKVYGPDSDVVDHGPQIVATLVPGASFGAEGFFSSTAQPWTIQAKTLLRTVAFTDADRVSLLASFPHDFHRLRRNLIAATQELADKAADLAVTMEERQQEQIERDREAARKLFVQTDDDGSGDLDRAEIAGLTRRLGLHLSPSEIEDALNAMDTDSDGVVSCEEFMQWFSVQCQSPSSTNKNEVAAGALDRLKRAVRASTGIGENNFVVNLSQRTKLHTMRIWLEPPQEMTPSLVKQFALDAQASQEEVLRSHKRASDDLAGLICALASTGDTVGLSRILSLVPILEIPADYDGRAGLHLAAASGHAETVNLLLDQGAAINVVDRFGRTPLAEAVLNGEDELITVLRSRGAQLMLSQVELSGKLCAAAEEGDNKMLQRYLDAGADPDSADYDKRTALMLAAAEGSLKTCELLLKYGADRNFKDRWGHTAETEAAFHQHTGPLLELLKPR